MKRRKNKTILIFTGFYVPHLGGVERYTEGLANELSKDNKVVVVTSNVPDGKAHERKGNIEIYRLPVRSFLKNRLPFPKRNKQYKQLLEEVQKIDADNVIVNTRYYYTTTLGLSFARERGIRPVIIDHSSGYIMKPYERMMLRKIKKYQPVYYGVSNRTIEWLKELSIEGEGVFCNSVVDRELKPKKKHDGTDIVYVARLIKEKGVELLVDAYNQIKDKNDISLTVIGDGPLLEQLKRDNPDICFTGNIPHEKVLGEIAESDIFAFPTLYPEGFPTVILEAAQAGCLIITTNRGGIAELINKNNGILLKDDASDLLEKLEYAITHTEEMKKKRRKVKSDVMNKYTWSKTGKYVREELEKYERS